MIVDVKMTTIDAQGWLGYSRGSELTFASFTSGKPTSRRLIRPGVTF